ncbi:LacI family DNA-binding transcriptional regulator [Rariglobus hedericola]|nr:LacI family DNA-binding transcriptional regulator [Rariglobus hedericola]
MRQIATAAGVSVATVSMALRNSEKITPETREKVRAAAAQLNYRPDPLIAALSGRRREQSPASIDIIAYITAYPTKEGWRENRFSPAAYEGACARASQRGYRIEHFWLRDAHMTTRRLTHILRSRGILGVCLAPFPDVVPQFQFPWDEFCCAAIGYTMRRPAIHRACPHQFQGMQLALSTLRLRGYKRIGVALGKRVSKIVAHNWIAAVLMHQYEHGRSSATCLIYEESDRVELTGWMRDNKPDAMIVSDIALLEWFSDLGISIPSDLAVVPLERYPGYACLDQKPHMVGAAAIDMIIGMIQRNETGLPSDPKTVMVEGSWTEGPSVKPVA